jgi:hypothetical protein
MKNPSPSKPDTAPPSPSTSGDLAKKLYLGGAAVCFLFSLVLYVKTMAASASFWDAGEFIAAAYTLGIPHSPGTPLYVLVGRVFTLLPLPFFSIAERVNLLSAFCGALGVFFIYILTIRFLDYVSGKSVTLTDTVIKITGGLVAALFITVSDTYWNNAIEAEVYAMSTALMGFMTWLVFKWGDDPKHPRSASLVYLIFYLLAMSVGFHLGTVLAFTGIFLFIYLTKDKPFSNVEFIVACLCVAIFVADATLYRNGQFTLYILIAYAAVILWMYSRKQRMPLIVTLLFVLGVSVHLYLKIRSAHNPAIDEVDPETWRSLYAVLRREQYPPMNALARKAGFFFQITHFSGYFQNQFQMASAYIGKLNIGAILPLALGIWGMADQFSRHKKTFIMLFATFVVVSLGLVIFLNFSDAEVRERDYFYSPAFFYFAIYIGIGAASLLTEIKNLLTKRRAAVMPVLVVSSVVLLALPLFTLNHYYFSHDRSNNYLCPVYARNMLMGLDKDGIVFTNGDNDTFPLWYIQDVEGYRKDVKVINLSLLQTPWYIKQCRDNEPKVPITWSTEQIDNIRPVMTSSGPMQIRDLAVQHILAANRFKRPIYFAVTIPPETYAPYRDYLEMEGLVYLVVPRKGENMVNVEKLQRNIVSNFDYTGILDENWKRQTEIYHAPHVTHLIQNYAAAFIQLSIIMHRDSLYDEAVRYMEIAHEISPHRNEPMQLLGWYYLDAGDAAKAIDFYENQVRANPQNLELKYRLAASLDRVGNTGRALVLLDELLVIDPENRELFMAAVGMALHADYLAKAREYLTNWVRRNPNDTTALQALQDITREIQDGATRRE